MAAEVNRQWRLASRPRGTAAEAAFSYHEEPRPAVADGQFLVRTLYVALDPELRERITGSAERPAPAADSSRDALAPDDIPLTSACRESSRGAIPPEDGPPLPVGAVMRGPALGQVVESRHRGFAAGDFVSGLLGWQDYNTSDGSGEVPVQRFEPVHPLPRYLGALGDGGLTAYFGMLEVARPRAGEMVVVSGAAGAAGATAAQIAKIRQCRVIGVASGPARRRRLTESLGLDAAVDGRPEDLGERLRALCPGGVDVCFADSEWRTIEVVLDHMATWGRIVLCGATAAHGADRPRAGAADRPVNDAGDVDVQHDADRPRAGPADLARLVARRVRMEGFAARDYAPRFKEARRQLSAWLATGALRSCEDVREGFENVPRAFHGQRGGAGLGQVMVKLADPA